MSVQPKSDAVSADAWFAAGERVSYDPRTVTVTMMPGYPDGSFGWARVEHQLASTRENIGAYS